MNWRPALWDLACLHRCLDGAARAERRVPLDRIGEVVKLPQVDVVNTKALEGSMELIARGVLLSRVGLGRDEEAPGFPLQPWGHAQLGIAVARGHVDVVDAMTQQHLEGSVRGVLRHKGQRRSAEDRSAAPVAGSPEGVLPHHRVRGSPCPSGRRTGEGGACRRRAERGRPD